ncbi:calcium-binding protein [Methylophaga thalassica]|uniref:calcium-binding protein n=1 Tax=Methylophaga thalassica TaxID=40223 RepID=UPI002E7BF03F|nr:calcium-binding protein [Methylophaga thalassica]WVI86762.1 calcium-binding protein [Methylophaga thalassica]
MVTKVFNSTETSYTGTSDSDLVIGNDLGNFIDSGAGDDIIIGGDGNDFLFGGSGNDIIAGGAGDDFIIAESGNNIISGGDGNDSIEAGNGNDIISGDAGDDNIYGYGGKDIIYGGDGDDVIYGGDGDDILSGGNGFDIIEGQGSTLGDETVTGNKYLVTSNDILLGGNGNDTFVVDDEFEQTTYIQGGASGLDNSGDAARYINVSELEGEEEEEEGGEEEEELVVFDTVTGEYVEIEDQEMSEEIETDVRLNLVTRPGSTEINTAASTVAGYNAVDTLQFTQSGDFDESLSFTGIERIELDSGVNITLSSEQFENNGESLSLGFLNPGMQVHGVAGGPSESVTVEMEFEEAEFEPDEDILGAEEVEYDYAEFSVEEFAVANLFHNVDMIYDASEGEEGSFTHVYGGNESAGATETVYGSAGVDYGVMNGGNDTYYGGDGNDVLVGGSGADSLYGEDGDDIFLVGGFGSGNSGTTSAADDGNQEWIATGAEHDLIVGGDGVDTLRITTGVGADTKANGTIVLNDANFQGMEVVQVGGTVDQLNVENDALQMLNDHYYFAANGTVDDLDNSLGNNGGTIDNVVVDASGVTANGLRFEGNGNDNTFIGTTQDDVFVGNGGNDTLTGGDGADTFVFGQVHEQVVTGDDDEVQTYVDTAFNLTGIDTITDFLSGVDKIALNIDQFTSLTVGSFTADNLVCSVGAAAGDANDFLLFDTSTGALSYDADGSGAGAAVQFATLTGVTSLSASDIEVFA